MNKKKLLQSIIVILVFLIAVYGRQLLNQYVTIAFDSVFIKLMYSYAWWIIPIILVLGFLYGFKNILKELCLDKGLFIGLFFSLVAVSPMLISSVIIGELNKDISWLSLLQKTFFAGFTEEILFRGFLFGILFRKLGWGFIPASLLGAVIFGLGHLYQGSTTSEIIGIFLITFVGSSWFAWLFVEWDENLWIPIFLHSLMNLSWILFDVSDNALGGIYTNIFRFVTIAITIFATIKYNLKRDKFGINKKNLFINRTTNAS